MSKPRRQIKFSAFIAAAGHHPAAWRRPDWQSGTTTDLSYWIDVARTAERGKLDAVFLADGVGFPPMKPGVTERVPLLSGLEPLTLLSAIAAVTRDIGLICTTSTTFSEPYNVARQFASLDHISGGRAGWNVVTSQGDYVAQNFGYESIPSHDHRYERAAEFLEVVKGLWDSWDDDALAAPDKEGGVIYDPEAVHAWNHRGTHFQVKGPLNVLRPPQGYPVIIQAGASDAGRDLAARTAEMIYTPAQNLAAAQAYYTDVKGRMDAYNRDPDHLLITPGIFPVVGESVGQAEDRYGELQDLVDPAVGLSVLSNFTGGFDLSGYPVDGPLPDLPATEDGQGRMKLLTELARSEGLSIRQLYLRFAVVRGHRLVLGTAETIADELEEWFTNGGADGFNIVPPVLPQGLDDFVDYVIPELQRRGLFRLEYEGSTLRDRLGLPRPVSRWARELVHSH
jgi:N-acetyl-S-(2-succino)cysteine monooxygenase